jgi:hypothetical protein
MEGFPIRPQIPFESHLYGALTGIAPAVAPRNLDPPPEKKYCREHRMNMTGHSTACLPSGFVRHTLVIMPRRLT